MLNVIAAVLIGGTAFTGGDGGLFGTAIGVLFLGVVQNALQLSSVSTFWQGTVSGSILILAVGIGVLRDRGAIGARCAPAGAATRAGAANKTRAHRSRSTEAGHTTRRRSNEGIHPQADRRRGRRRGRRSRSAATATGFAADVIGDANPVASNPNQQAITKGEQQAAKAYGWSVKTLDANLSPDKQVSDVDAFISLKTKGIIIWTLDPGRGRRGVQAGDSKAGIPVDRLRQRSRTSPRPCSTSGASAARWATRRRTTSRSASPRARRCWRSVGRPSLRSSTTRTAS